MRNFYYVLYSARELAFTICLLMLTAWTLKRIIEEIKQKKKVSLAQYVRPTGETDAHGNAIPKYMKNEWYIKAATNGEHVLLAQPLRWVRIDEVETRAEQAAREKEKTT